MDSRALIDAEIESVKVKLASAKDPADRTNLRLALHLLNDEKVRDRWVKDKP